MYKDSSLVKNFSNEKSKVKQNTHAIRFPHGVNRESGLMREIRMTKSFKTGFNKTNHQETIDDEEASFDLDSIEKEINSPPKFDIS